jgi:hypothetical protein
MVEKRLKQPKQYTENEFALKRAEAKAMFLAGRNPEEIDQSLGLRNGRSLQWARKHKWTPERDIVMAKTTQTRLQQLLDEHDEIISELNTIRQKAYDPIFLDKVLPKKFSEASNAYIATVDALRKLRTDSIHESFMNDLIQACKELITDEDLLFRIGERFREIYNGHQTNTVSTDETMVQIEKSNGKES